MTQGGVPTTKAGTGRTIGKAALERLLVESAPEPGEPASTLYLRPGEGQEFLESLGATGQDWRERLTKLNDSILEDSSSWMSTKKLGLKDSVNLHSVELKISKLMTFLTGSNATGRVA